MHKRLIMDVLIWDRDITSMSSLYPANPTGPLHAAHARGAIFGDALAHLLEFAGYNVTREYYINDAGAQVNVLARSAYLRYREAFEKRSLSVRGCIRVII